MSSKSESSISYNFLLPLIGKTYLYYSPYLLNVYIADNTMKDYNTPGNIFLLISNTTQFERLLTQIRGFDSYVAEYPVSDFETMVVLKIPEALMSDYYKCLDGKYSMFSPEAKRLITVAGHPDSNNIKIINKSPELKSQWEAALDVTLPDDAEVYYKLDIEKETYIGVREGETPL